MPNMRLRHGLAPALFSTLLAAAGASLQAAAPQAPTQTAPAEAAAPEAAALGDPAEAKPSESEVAELFNAESYAARERTMRQLWGDYGQSRERVRELAKSSNPEVAQRAEWILRRWQIGLMPELPEAVRRNVADADGRPALALMALLEGGYLREAVEVARQQTLGAGSDEIRAQLGAVVAHRYLGILDEARRTDSLDLVLELLDQCAEPTPLAVARALLLDRLGRTVDPSNLLPACAARWTPARRDEVTVIALTVLGRFDEAIAAAERSKRADLLSTVLLLDARWAPLAAVARESIHPQLPTTASLPAYATWMVAAHEAGLAEQAAEAAAKVAASEDPSGVRWRALAVAGRFDEAIEVAEGIDRVAAAELCSTRQRHSQAFEVLGIDPAELRESLAEMLREVAIPESPTAENQAASAAAEKALDRLLAATRLLHMVGRQRIAVETLRNIAELAASDGAPPNARREAAMLAMRIGYDSLVPELVIDDDNQELDDELSFHLGYILGDRAPNFFNTVGVAIQRMRTDDSPRDRFRASVELFAGRLPAGWDRRTDLDALHEQLTQAPSPETSAPQMNIFRQNGLIRSAALHPSYLLGDLFARLGRSDLARRCYQRAVDQGDIASILRFADLELLAGNSAAALTLYETAFKDLQTDWSGKQFGFVEPINGAPPSATAALAGRAVALQRLGRIEQSEAVWETLRLAPLNPAADSGRDFVDRLGTLEQPDRQREAARTMLLYAAFDRAKDRNFYSQTITHASRLLDTDPAAAARWMRIAVIGNLATAQLYPSGYLTIPARWHAAEAVAAARGGDEDRAGAHLQSSLDYFPLNIAMAEEDLPKIRAAGFDALADTAVDRIFQTGLAYLDQFGLDANTTNNLAWVTAINGRHYDRSLTLARRAVFLVPDNVSYRDTLAELLFRVGRRGEAVEIQRQCLRDQPDLWHIHEQIERFSKANRE